MALFQIDFFSKTLGLSTSMNVVLPDGPAGEGFPALFLLHGLSDDHTIWLRRTSIERYAEACGLAVVMPNVHRSFYTDMKTGFPYWRYISEEVPALVRSWFPLSDARERNFAAGLSMGGYGAFKLALRCPDRFAAAASLSGALDMVGRWPEEWEEGFPRSEYRRIFGGPDELGANGDDLFVLAGDLAAAEGKRKPALFQCCGTEDELYGMNVKFRDFARSLGFDLHYEDGPGGHEWGYWDRQIRRVLDWLPLTPDEGRL